MNIHIDALTFNTIIGLLDFERNNPQEVTIELETSYEYENRNFINYADMVTLIKNELQLKKYELLEDALLGLKHKIYTTYPQIKTLKIKISKPNILPDCTVALSNSWEF
jgi:dihydroneopterin aldolase